MEQNNYKNKKEKEMEKNQKTNKDKNTEELLDEEKDTEKKDINGNSSDESIKNSKNSNLNDKNDNENDEVADLNNKLAESEEKYKRLLAEFDNFRKRTEKDKAMMTDFGATLILSNFLPVIDDFERAVNNIPDDLKENTFSDGVKKIYEKLNKTLEDLKVTPIKSKGEKFDQNIHNAVMMDEESDCEEGTITEELQKGFMYKDQVLRHAMVKVKK